MEKPAQTIRVVTPYNTGKMMIGYHYVDYKNHPMTQDGFRLQSALLASRRQRDADKDDRIVLIGMIAIAIGLPIAAYVFNWTLGG